MGECDSFYHATNESPQGVLWVIGERRMIQILLNEMNET